MYPNVDYAFIRSNVYIIYGKHVHIIHIYICNVKFYLNLRIEEYNLNSRLPEAIGHK